MHTRFNRAAALAAGAAAAVLLATSAASASPASPSVPNSGQAICANGGSGLCLQNNGLANSIVANDGANGSEAQQWDPGFIGGTAHGAPSAGGFPFSTAALNNQIAPGRNVWQIASDKSGGVDCLGSSTAFDGTFGLVSGCTGSHAMWVASGSGRLISVGESDNAGQLVFIKSDGTDGDQVEQAHNPDQTCPGACWGGF
jgi:hypothetical protein